MSRNRKFFLVGMVSFATLLILANGWFSIKTIAFHQVHKSPILQNLTRAAFVFNDLLFLSTLETYDSAVKSRTVLATIPLSNPAQLTKRIIEGSNEIRSFAFDPQKREFFIAGSLDPQILRWDPLTSEPAPFFRAHGASGWFHQIAQDSSSVYAILSSAAPLPQGLSGVLRINKSSGKHELLPFPPSPSPSPSQTYGGIQTVDPTGRVWFYRAYPYQNFWHDGYGTRLREMPGYAGWQVESWDALGTDTYVTLVRGNARSKVCADLTTLMARSNCRPNPQFSSKIRIDLYHQSSNLGEWYWDTEDRHFYKRAGSHFDRNVLAPEGTLKTSTIAETPLEFPVTWVSPGIGEWTVLGGKQHAPLIWKVGTKAFAIARGARSDFTEVPLENLSSATISALAHDEQGNIYGGGLLTQCNLFRYSPENGSSVLLPPVVDNTLGQVNTLFTGIDNQVIGSVYPGSILFSYNTSRPWEKKLNPLAFRFPDSPTLMRAYRGIQDKVGDLYFQATSDYSDTNRSALQIASLRNGKATALSEPPVIDVADWDESNVAVLFRKKGTLSIGLLDKQSRKLSQSTPLGTGDAFLSSFQGASGICRRMILFNGVLYEIDESLGLHEIFDSKGKAKKIYIPSCNEWFLVGVDSLINFKSSEGKVSTINWNHFGDLGNRLFYEDHWLPITLVKRRLYIGYKSELWAAEIPSD